MSLISNDDVFLCKSGYEITSLGDRCNVHPDCDDKSDERNCDHCKFIRYFDQNILRGRTLKKEMCYVLKKVELHTITFDT